MAAFKRAGTELERLKQPPAQIKLDVLADCAARDRRGEIVICVAVNIMCPGLFFYFYGKAAPEPVSLARWVITVTFKQRDIALTGGMRQNVVDGDVLPSVGDFFRQLVPPKINNAVG